MNRKASAKDQNVHGSVAGRRTDGEPAELPGSSRDRSVVGDLSIKNEQRKQGSEKALCLT